MKFFSVYCFVLWLSLCGVVHADSTARLFADSDGESIQLTWAVYGWPDNLTGFRLQRKSPTESRWSEVGGTIRPEVGPDRTYASQGLNPEQAKQLNAAYEAMAAKRKVRAIDADTMLKLLRKAGGLSSGDRVNFAQDFNRALIFGYAAIDNEANPESDYTYGLFPVYKGSRIGDAPLATFEYSAKLGKDETYLVDLKAGNNLGVSITWDIEEEKYWALSILGYSIHRRSLEPGSEWVTLVDGGYGTSVVEDGVMKFSFRDRDAYVSDSYEYGVAPINYFQRQCAMSTAVYKPEAK